MTVMETPQLETHSCRLCSNVIFDLRTEFLRSSKALLRLQEQLDNGTLGKEESKPAHGEDGEDMSRKGALFNVTFKELCKGADAGCHFFNRLMDDEWFSRETIHAIARKELDIDNPSNKLGWAFRDSSLWVDSWLPEVNAANTLFKLRPLLGTSVDECLLWASTYQGSGNPLDIEFIQFFGLWDPVSKKIIYRARSSFQVFALDEDLASTVISNRPIAKHPSSVANLALCSSWLNACQQDHKCVAMHGEMPTRLLKIDGMAEETSLRLISTAVTGQITFAALSYCWGGEQPLQLTKHNLVDYTMSIPLLTQPQTIQDAVKVCQALGFQYLWNDALCILQDDPNDKAIEISKMPTIYGSATVTIIAARSTSASEGFLGERCPELKEGFNIAYCCPDGQLGSINLVQLGGSFEGAEPIDERGWTLQERLCSSRIIEFGSRQTRWICPETRSPSATDEGLTDGWRKAANYNSKRTTEGLNLEHIRTAKACIDIYGRPRNSRRQDYATAMKHWEDICRTFTERTLTLPSDRPLAISGIAQIFAELSGDQYAAGLWKSCLHSGLLWKIEHRGRGNIKRPRPTIYQGPSWSWLSVNGPVFFGRSLSPAECTAEILSVEAEPANTAAPYGLVRQNSGRLILCARTTPGSVIRKPLRKAGTFKYQVMLLGIARGVVCYTTGEMDLDIEVTEEDADGGSTSVQLVEITRGNERDGNISIQGLVLDWSDFDRKTYSRVGRFSYWGLRKGRKFAEHIKEGEDHTVDFNWFSDEPKVIEIV